MVTCSNCKEIFHENATHCPACGTEAHPIKPKMVNVKSSAGTTTYSTTITAASGSELIDLFSYATFGNRVVACIIDCVIVSVVSSILGAVLGAFGTIAAFALTACYYGYFESSQYMGTPGKIVMKLKVLSVNGQPISFANGIGRYAARIISAAILGIGYLFPLFTAKKQALHDIIAGCIVVKA